MDPFGFFWNFLKLFGSFSSKIHYPFGDGNGRITRLITNYILHKNDYPMFDIDAKIRYQYYNALEKADMAFATEFPFIQWFFKNYIKANKSYL